MQRILAEGLLTTYLSGTRKIKKRKYREKGR